MSHQQLLPDPMTPIDLARILRSYGIGPEVIRFKPYLVYKGYHAGGFKTLWQRHLNEYGKADQMKTGAPSFAFFAKGGKGRKVTAVTTGNRNRQYSCGL